MTGRILAGLLSSLLILGVKPAALAQEKSAAPAPAVELEKKADSKEEDKTAVDSGTSSTKPKPAAGRLTRWFELQAATLNARYRFIRNSAGVTTSNSLQHKEVFKGRFKFDGEGRYSINAGLFSGRTFTGTWENTGLGIGQGQTNLALKQLYLAAQPIKGVEFQYGGLYLVRGESSEITTYDEDGYIVGERISLRRPDKLFFDEVSVTYAYLGDLNTPNLNKRYHRLKQSNYHQFLVGKKIGQRAAVSADYTFQSGRETLRQAVKLSLPELRVVDAIRFENYQRVDARPDYGFALSGEKTIAKRLTLGGGYAQIDPHYGSGLNADRFDIGRRVFLSGSFQLSPEFTISGFAGRGVANGVPISQRSRFDVIFSYNLLKSLQRTGLF